MSPQPPLPSASTGSLTHLAVAGYRSLQPLTLPLGAQPHGGLTLVCGANGCGVCNLYRSLGLVSAAARGDLVAALAAEGGYRRCSLGRAGAHHAGDAPRRAACAGQQR